jgi:tetratricopeptide (TPR) repeat protein
LKSSVHPVVKPVDSELEGPDEPSVTNDKSHYSPYKLPDTLEPVIPSVFAVDRPTPVPPTLPGSYHGGVTVEGMDNVVGVTDLGTGPVKAPSVAKNLLSPAPIAPPRPDHGVSITLEGMDNIVGVSDDTAGGSAERIAVMPEPASSHWLPALREIKQHIDQFTEGRIEKTYRFDQVRVIIRSAERVLSILIVQDESSNRVQLRRCGVRLLMSSASLSPADFASPVGFLGPSESTPYYPTGDLQGDRTIAFTTAMDCLLDLMEFHPHGNDEVKIATTLFELAQALSDLGLHKYALDTSSFALDTLERPFVATPNDFRHHVASILSLQANILCDLKQNDEAVEKAHRSVTLFREHQDSQTTPVPEFAFALLNYSVLLSSVGLKDESAAVAFELGEVDGLQSDMKDVSALCNLCLSNMRFDAEDGTDLSTTEKTIELTRTSSDSIPQMALACALLNKSKILSSRGQNEAAIPFGAEAVTLLRGMSTTRHVFSLFLVHALDTHAHHLSEANRKGESYSIRRDAVELWQTLKVSAPGPVARPLAWSLFELAKFRHQGGEKNVLREELRIAECAVEAFRGVEPPDVPGLGDALYLFANRMLELDKNREAATYAEESVHHFREASAEDQKYALDLIFSLSLASSCLAYTERNEDALEYAKQAVAVQHGRKGVEDKQFDAHLRRLLMDVVIRSMEMNKERETLPWLQELQSLDPSIGMHGFPHFDQ